MNKKEVNPEKEKNRPIIVIDGKDSVLGRICTLAAKQTLLGKKVVIVNCSAVIVSGKKKNIIEEYRIARNLGSPSFRGPFFPKHPYRLVKRTVRGMLAHRQGRGSVAIKRVMCYDECPEEYVSAKKISVKKALNTNSMTLKEIGEKI